MQNSTTAIALSIIAMCNRLSNALASRCRRPGPAWALHTTASSASAAPAIPAAAVPDTGDEDVNRALRAIQSASFSLELVQLIHGSRKLDSRVKSVCAMAQRDPDLVDLSLMIEAGRPGSSAPVLHHLIRLYSDTCAYDSDSAEVSKEKAGLHPLFASVFSAPLLPTLLSRFNPLACAEPSGNNALAELLQLTTPMTADDWPACTARMLVSAGVSVHQHNKLGRPPLLAGIVAEGRRARSAFWISLLVSSLHADLNAADDDGRTLLHFLVSKRIVGVLFDLTKRPELLSRIDWFVPDKQGCTAAELAAAALEQRPPLLGDELESARCIAAALQLHVRLWRKHSKPIVFAALCSSTPLLPVLAEMVCHYLDGSGPNLHAAPPSPSPSPDPQHEVEAGDIVLPLDA